MRADKDCVMRIRDWKHRAECRGQKCLKSEVRPVVVPSGWDYAAVSMRKPEMRKKTNYGSRNAQKEPKRRKAGKRGSWKARRLGGREAEKVRG